MFCIVCGKRVEGKSVYCDDHTSADLRNFIISMITDSVPSPLHMRHNDIVPYGEFSRELNKWYWFGDKLEDAPLKDLERVRSILYS